LPTKAVSVGTSAVALLEESRNRTAIIIANPDTAAILYISDEKDQCSTTQGMPIFPQTYIMLSVFEGVNTEAKWWVISDTLAKNARVIELYGKSPQEIVPPSQGVKPGDPETSWKFGKVMQR